SRTTTGSRFPDRKALVPRWRAVLAAYGVTPDVGAASDAAERVNGSLVRDRVLTVLDQWLANEPSAGLRAVLQAADPDPYRDAVRNAVAAGDNRGVAALSEAPEALAQPSRFAAVLGAHAALSKERRRAVLQAVLRTRPGDVGLLMMMEQTYPDGR